MSSAVTDPEGPFIGTNRVVRGSNWTREANRSRAVYRSYVSPDLRLTYMGFRAAKTVLP